MDEDSHGAPVGSREKLIRAKEQWARDGRLLTGTPDTARRERLPPGQRLVKDWPVLDLGIQPQVTPEQWKLTIDGLVERPVTLNWHEFRKEPQVQLASDIHCVTAWSRYDNQWEGVASRRLLDMVRPKPEARHVLFESYDGYTTNVALEVFADSDVLLAHSWEGKSLSREHGGPVRVVIPRWYFWKSPKWVRRITFAAQDRPGFWEIRGYHNEGDPWKEERYSD